ncbi:hypothetical protein BB561_001404 [Smittium simulii]|uniref:Sphingomyelin synthase-like domain-containing protein n=1 Tax=Smittium simulii TaxID=133385 RepID=A0A2T9YUS9_9FUNG|nr:hypothetical protein BB561_001404 [Smittium simulii]
MANLASKRSFNIIPQKKLLWYTDFSVNMMIGLAVINLLFYPRPWRFFARFLLSWTIALILRITTVATTSVPDPRLDCEFVTGNVFTSVSLHRCGDAIYSGHTIVYATCFMTFVSFSPDNWAGRIGKLIAFCRLLALEFPFGVGKKIPNEPNAKVKKRLIMLSLDKDGNKADYSDFVPDNLFTTKSEVNNSPIFHAQQPDTSSQTIDILR